MQFYSSCFLFLELAVSKGEPVNPPIWWIAPEDKIAQSVDDEFMLGDWILAAPVIKQGEFICLMILIGIACE